MEQTAAELIRVLNAEMESLNWAFDKSAPEVSEEIKRLSLSDDPDRIERMDCLFQSLRAKVAP
jgi:hypothetical protein